MMRAIKVFAAVAVIAAVGAACRHWEEWDKVFKRSVGWKGSDGGYSVMLPPATTGGPQRVLWMFGDTIHWPDSNGLEIMMGNTIGVSNIRADRWTPPAAADISFFARRATTECSVPGACPCVGSCPLTDISSTSPTRLRGWEAPPNAEEWIWPSDGAYVPQPEPIDPAFRSQNAFPGTGALPDFMAVFHTRVGCTPGSVFATAQGICCKNGVCGFANSDAKGQYLRVYRNIKAAPSSWIASSPIALPTDPDQISWGNALYHDGGDKVWIFGVKAQSAEFPEGTWRWKDATLAVAWPEGEITNYNRWWFLYNDGWRIGPPEINGKTLDDLKIVAGDVASEFTVDFVSHVAHSDEGTGVVDDWRLVMVHGATAPLLNADCTDGQVSFTNGRELVIRTTQDLTSWPSSAHGGNTYRHDMIREFDSHLLCGHNAGREVRAVKGQAELSGPGALHVSYYLGEGTGIADPELWYSDLPASQHTEANRVSNLRFMPVPLTRLQPWCQVNNTCPPPL